LFVVQQIWNDFKETGWRTVKPCDIGIDPRRLAASQNAALRHPARSSSG
jgi:hypothetical protein